MRVTTHSHYNILEYLEKIDKVLRSYWRNNMIEIFISISMLICGFIFGYLLTKLIIRIIFGI